MNRGFFLILLLVPLVSACLRRPISYPEPDKVRMTSNSLLSDIRTWSPKQGAPIVLPDSLIFYCRVSADDASGNFHEQLILEDSTGGICLLLNESNLFQHFPAGTSVYLKAKGLYLGNSHGTLQLGGPPVQDNKGVLQVSSLPASQIASSLFLARDSLSLHPLVVSIAALRSAPAEYVNRLLQLQSVEWEDPIRDDRLGGDFSATNTVLQDCTGATLIVRTSNYATFRAASVPFGSGRIRGVFTVYEGEGQLQIRDLGDVEMNEQRCDGSSGNSPDDITVAEVRNSYKGKDTLLGAYTLRGVVTSDAAHGNFGSGNIVLQQGGMGITIFFGTSVSGLPDLGDSISVYLNEATLSSYNGLLEIKNINVARVKVHGRNIDVAPLTLTLAELNSRFAELESVLVRVERARVATGGKYSGNRELSDGTGTITLYTSSSATFANDPVPSISKTYQGIVTPYGTTKELKIRSPERDVY